jgi:diguanylate cyclase (GGDEF)-like protein
MNIISRIKNLIPIDENLVATLYNMTKSTITIVFILTVLTTYFLFPVLGEILYYWCGLLILLLLYRIYLLHGFLKNKKKYTIRQWYIKFVISSLATASFFSILALLMVPYSENILAQLLVAMLLMGYASGSQGALMSDVRLGITYISLLLVPLMLVFFSYDTDFFHYLAIFVFFHLVSFILILLSSYKRLIELSTVHKTLENKQTLLNYYREESPLPIFSCDTNLEIIDANNALAKLLKRERTQIIGMNIHNLPTKKLANAILKAMKEGSSQYTGTYHSIYGVHLWVEIIFLAQYASNKEMIGVIGLIDDKTNEHKILKQLEYTSVHDELTGLLNRRGFLSKIGEYIIKKDKKYSLLFYLDLNQFKVINDSLGHEIGDKVLIEVAQRLKKIDLGEVYISRFGGDEFVLFISSINKEHIDNMAEEISLKIQNIFSNIFLIRGMHLNIYSSIGVVIIKPEHDNVEDILRYSDLSMYRAKKTKEYISYYDPSLDTQQKELFDLQHDLSSARENNELRLFFQPIVNIKTNELISAEQLLRWEHPTKGLLSPDMFIPLAIKAGLLYSMTWWIIDEVCKQILVWKKAGQWKLKYISININARQLIEEDFVDVFLEKLSYYNIETKDIILEITERSLIDNFEQTQNIISELKFHGVLCAIDDFGVGYSSLSYLHKLSCHILKIDRSFIQDIHDDEKEKAILKTILELGERFEYKIIVEGIENIEQQKSLCQLNDTLCYQGYIFSKPLKIETFTNRFLS